MKFREIFRSRTEGETSEATAAPLSRATSPRPVFRADPPAWATLPVLQRSLQPMAPVAAVHFEDSLQSWRDPTSTLSPLSHVSGSSEPSGAVDGLLRVHAVSALPVPRTTANHSELLLRQSAASVQRQRAGTQADLSLLRRRTPVALFQVASDRPESAADDAPTVGATPSISRGPAAGGVMTTPEVERSSLVNAGIPLLIMRELAVRHNPSPAASPRVQRTNVASVATPTPITATAPGPTSAPAPLPTTPHDPRFVLPPSGRAIDSGTEAPVAAAPSSEPAPISPVVESVVQREIAQTAPLLAERPIETAAALDSSASSNDSDAPSASSELNIRRRPGLGAPLAALPPSARPFNQLRGPQAPRSGESAPAVSRLVPSQQRVVSLPASGRVEAVQRATTRVDPPEIGPVALEDDRRTPAVATSPLVGSREPLVDTRAADDPLALGSEGEASPSGAPTLQLLRSDDARSSVSERDVSSRGFDAWPWVAAARAAEVGIHGNGQSSGGGAATVAPPSMATRPTIPTPAGMSRNVAAAPTTPVVVRPDALRPFVQLPGATGTERPSPARDEAPVVALQRVTPGAPGMIVAADNEATTALVQQRSVSVRSTSRSSEAAGVQRQFGGGLHAASAEIAREAPANYDVARSAVVDGARARAAVQRAVISAMSPTAVPATPSAIHAAPPLPRTVQRVQASTAPSASAAPDVTPVGDSDQELSTEGVHKLVAKLYPLISYRLRTELGIDRDRAGMTTGLHR